MTVSLCHSKKDPYPTHRGNFGEGEGNCLKNVLNPERREGGIVHSLRGGMDLFWNDPIVLGRLGNEGSQMVLAARYSRY